MRPKQWVKNVLVFIAPIAAGTLLHGDVFLHTMVAFIAFSMAASGTYLVNDIRDIESDRAHHKKRHRPIAKGELSVPLALVVAFVLLVGGIVVGGLGATWELGVVLIAYVAITLVYSMFLKTEPVIELACVAAGFVLRAVGGGAASNTPLSVWFVVVISFGALFLVIGKRLAELPDADGQGGERRAVLSKYSKSYLESALTMTATASVTGYCLWAFENTGLVQRAHGREIWIHLTAVPVVIGALYVLRSLDAGEGGAPEDLAFNDRIVQGLGVLWIILAVIGIYG
jgi:decaprenyl-phosphate phosphoribosyltransferase